MYVAAGQPFTATLIDPGGFEHLLLGARIEVPVTRAIVGYWMAATLSGYVWSVTMDAPPAQSANPGYDPVLDDALAAGEFQIVWMDNLGPPTVEIYVPLHTTGTGTGTPTVPPSWPPVDVAQCTPSVDDVAALEGTRRVDDTTAEQPTFNANTRPTDTEVQALIDQAVPVVMAQLRPTFPISYYDEVSHAIALYAAILVEGSYYREQINTGSVGLYQSLLNQSLAGIAASLELELNSLAASGGRLH